MSIRALLRALPLMGAAAALAAVPSSTPSAPPPPSSAPAASDSPAPLSGPELFATANPRCIICHSVAGKGNPKGVALDGVGKRLGRDDIRAWIRTPREMAKKRGSTRKPAMVPYPEFTDEEVEALVDYLAGLPARP